jgi:hypothetical protein
MATTKSKRGRKPSADSKSGKIREMIKAGKKPMDIAKQLKCTPGLVYNVRSKMSGVQSKKPAAVRVSKAAIKGDGLEAIVAAVKNAEVERARMRTALERIQKILSEALA